MGWLPEWLKILRERIDALNRSIALYATGVIHHYETGLDNVRWETTAEHVARLERQRAEHIRVLREHAAPVFAG